MGSAAPSNVSSLPSLVFGLGGLHRLPFPRQRQRLIKAALETGFRAFDVAPAYGNGLDEMELGIALAGRRSEVRIATKYGIPMTLYGPRSRRIFPLVRAADKATGLIRRGRHLRRNFRAVEAVRSLEGSLRRLRTDYVDIFLIHEPVEPMSDQLFQEIGEAAAQLRRAGKIKAFGVAGGVGWIGSLVSDPAIEVIQLPLVDAPHQPSAVGKVTIAYAIFREYYRATGGREDFVGFVRTVLREQPQLRLILSTTTLSRLATFGEIFR
jgi:aryl-alcohol dehydrogenase-like predicted oxidoreductase